MNIFELTINDKDFPKVLIERLKSFAPAYITYNGNIQLLNELEDAWAIIGSVSFDNELIQQKYYEFIKFLAVNQITIISGFHSPIEKEALNIIQQFDGKAIYVKARSLYRMRINKSLKNFFDKGKILYLSTTSTSAFRTSIKLTQKRNLIVAALSSKVLILTQNKNSKTTILAKKLIEEKYKVCTISSHPTELFTDFDI